MKKMIFLLMFNLAAGVISSYAQSDSAKTGFATVYVIRATGSNGSAVNLRVYVDDEVYCRISNKHYSVLKIKTGTRTFYVTDWVKPKPDPRLGLELPLEAGKTYYLKMAVKKRFLELQFYFEEITKNSGLPLIEKYPEDTDCDG